MKLFEEIVSIERQTSREKGEFYLFALFLREESPDKWDLIVSAPWIEADKEGALRYLASLVQSRLTPSELLSLSKIVLIDVDNPALEAVQNTVAVEHGKVEVRDSNFFGLPIKQAYIITSKRGIKV